MNKHNLWDLLEERASVLASMGKYGGAVVWRFPPWGRRDE